jgi:PTH1 family peptidyl-tRNA hydrolase
VLKDFARADADWLDDLLRGISDGAAALAEGDSGRFMNAVSLRVAPPRSSGGGKTPARETPERKTATAAPEPAQTETPAPDPDPDPPKSALQRLVDRFR